MNKVIVGGLAILIALAQGMLLRAVVRVGSGAARGALLSVKFMLWAGFFVAIAFWDKNALLTGGLVAGLAYLSLGIWAMIHLRRRD